MLNNYRMLIYLATYTFLKKKQHVFHYHWRDVVTVEGNISSK
jgi:hypothetical protein